MQRFITTFLLFILGVLFFFACSNIDENPQIEDNSNQNQISKTCKLPSGQTVEDGFAGKDGGNNNCNYCDCTYGEYTCTEMSCR
jgi:hypothetical protein|tara:strand:- start:278 stop:529 length:252 start_codon:yes stop_codon:yes gene_type:complete